MYIKDHPFTDIVDFENWKDYQYETKIKKRGDRIVLEEGPRQDDKLTGYGRRITYNEVDAMMMVDVCPRWDLRNKSGFV